MPIKSPIENEFVEPEYEWVRTFFDYRNGVLVCRKEPDSANFYKNGNGYIRVYISGKRYYEHRLVFLWHHGYLPEYIDHINQDRSDNRIENLREATKSENQRNTKAHKDSKSGIKGVCWNERKQKWVAYVTVNKKQHHIGYFVDIEQAKKAVIDKRAELHGEFAFN